jgi:hypothetical protein
MQRHPALYRIAMLFLARNRTNAELPWAQVGATTLELANVAGISHSAVVELLDDFADRNILFNTGKHWELMVPAPFTELRQMSLTNESFRLELALFSVFRVLRRAQLERRWKSRR